MAENKAAPHSFVKDGVYSFVGRVLNDLRHHDISQISSFLRIRSVAVAASRAVGAAEKLDEYWYPPRIDDGVPPGKHMRRMAGNCGAVSAPPPVPAAAVAASGKRSEAESIYLRRKGRGCPITVLWSAERS